VHGNLWGIQGWGTYVGVGLGDKLEVSQPCGDLSYQPWRSRGTPIMGQCIAGAVWHLYVNVFTSSYELARIIKCKVYLHQNYRGQYTGTSIYRSRASEPPRVSMRGIGVLGCCSLDIQGRISYDIWVFAIVLTFSFAESLQYW